MDFTSRPPRLIPDMQVVHLFLCWLSQTCGPLIGTVNRYCQIKHAASHVSEGRGSSLGFPGMCMHVTSASCLVHTMPHQLLPPACMQSGRASLVRLCCFLAQQSPKEQMWCSGGGEPGGYCGLPGGLCAERPAGRHRQHPPGHGRRQRTGRSLPVLALVGISESLNVHTSMGAWPYPDMLGFRASLACLSNASLSRRDSQTAMHQNWALLVHQRCLGPDGERVHAPGREVQEVPAAGAAALGRRGLPQDGPPHQLPQGAARADLPGLHDEEGRAPQLNCSFPMRCAPGALHHALGCSGHLSPFTPPLGVQGLLPHQLCSYWCFMAEAP